MFHLLPVELLHQILWSCSDVTSLKSAALSCPEFYHAFKGAEASIVKRVLHAIIDDEVIADAFAIHQCRPPYINHTPRRLALSKEQIRELTDYARTHLRWETRPSVDTMTWTMSDAIQVVSFCRLVETFTDKFIESCATARFRGQVNIGQSLRDNPPNKQERGRIMRAFYWFETYCRLFGCLDAYNTFDGQFFVYFAYWEAIQLGCVHDYLGEELAAVFNDVAKHNVAYGQWKIDFKCTLSSPYVQNLMCMGLKAIMELISLKTYEERSRVLCPDDESPPQLLHSSLQRVLYLKNEMIEGPMAHGIMPKSFPCQAYAPDLDRGSKYMWVRSFDFCPQIPAHNTFAIYSDDDWAYRRWGYVMWDEERLVSPVLNLPKTWFSCGPLPGMRDHVKPKAMRPSWKRRSELWEKGGRGYWDENDESQVYCPFRTEKRNQTEEDSSKEHT